MGYLFLMFLDHKKENELEQIQQGFEQWNFQNVS